MNALLKKYIAAVLEESRNARVPNQLVSDESKGESNEEKGTEEMDEMSGCASIAGFTAPLGASSEDVKGPGAGQRRKKKTSARWK